jgi:1-acyl-sn-glycerol-3-phosphate acyltransferase
VRRKRPKLGFWLWLGWLISIPPTTALFRRTWRGIEHIPERGPAILAFNHVSYIDPLLVIRFVYETGRIPRVLAKSSLFSIFLFGRVLRRCKQIPVYRGSTVAGDSLRDAQAALAAGDAVVIYPEGTVTRDPAWWPMRSMTGVARLALASGAPVIPVAQWGAQFSVDWYAHRFRLFPRKRVVFQAGPPVDLSAYRGQPVTAALLREAADTIMRAVRDELADVRGEPAPEAFAPQPARASRPSQGSRKTRKIRKIRRSRRQRSADLAPPAETTGSADTARPAEHENAGKESG